MTRSLSAVLPVRNIQSSLEARVTEVLEVLVELSHSVEVILVDDGSEDATREVACELAPRYPQLRVAGHAEPRGVAEAIRTGLAMARGNHIFFQDAGCTLGIGEVQRLWRLAARHDIVVGRGSTGEPGLRHGAPPVASGSYQMVRRSMLLRLAPALHDGETFCELLARLGLPWYEIGIRDRRCQRELLRAASASQEPGAPRADRPDRKPIRPRRPNYLVRLKEFALGE